MEKISTTENRTPEEKFYPEWVRPNLEEERGEVERVVLEFLGKEITQENINQVIKILESAPLVDLSDKDWEVLENTDSFHNVKFGHLKDAEKITEEYNLDLAPNNKRNFKNLLAGFQGGRKMKAPTILRNSAGKLHLVSGNTRLMISRALGIRPKVAIGTIDSIAI
ncbi:MAG: hypothetical protein KBB86_02380 [Candidatus Pacebacteria bacterium]|nr:hypothetical protein [Candidatus Paceibacterota bacterium]